MLLGMFFKYKLLTELSYNSFRGFKMRARHRGGLFGGRNSLLRSITRVVRVNGQVMANGKKCILCKKCEKVCQVHAISVDKENRKWYIRHGACIKCYRCVKSCPKDALMILP